MKGNFYESLRANKRAGKKSVALLIDPDKIHDMVQLQRLINHALESRVDYFFVGGSLITDSNFSQVVQLLKQSSELPVILFPGSNMHLDPSADAILFLSLISGRNPELLIGQHVLAAPILRKSKLEVVSTGYILIDAGNHTTVSYMSNTQPIPHDKVSVAACTAMAGEMLGLKLMYLDAGSGADRPVSPRMISAVGKSIDTPLIVGGGINNGHKAKDALEAGADLLVLGNGVEKNPGLLTEVCDIVYAHNRTLNVH
ncbi:geranylgeranylglyceryl/heptaprenylglyceryl phosphate synthase [Roseivirga sp. BDSF3-8]|uniref:geranylgeranylglyceryl/heptaprenylglyceryl phosphate synthase n=1 Tax=Roseivirga sp. BDSF3-8 TaxID=3241598 RepID=UPI0035323A1C